MPVSKIMPIPPVVNMYTPQAAAKTRADFASLLNDAMQSVNQSDKEDKAANTEFALGGDESFHNVMLAGEKAEITLRLAVGVRNRLVESYQEIMRMQF